MVVVAAAAWSLGLGDGGGGSDAGIPIPQRNYTVQVTDTKGQTMEAGRFTWEGKVLFRGQLGNATITLPFQKLNSLKVLTGKKTGLPDTVAATVSLKSGETVEVSLKSTNKCYGETRFGNYEIFFKDVGEIVFNQRFPPWGRVPARPSTLRAQGRDTGQGRR